MKEIALTDGFIAVVDNEDFEYLSQWKWQAKQGKNNTYAVRKVGFKNIYMHRVVASASDGMDVDHVNHNSLDNRKENLRICTRSENLMNKRISKTNTTGYKGVGWHKRIRKYQARIELNNKCIHLGYFDTPEEAARAYDAKAKELFGKFAFLNFK